VEDEQWTQMEVSSSNQGVIETIMDCAVRDSRELVIKTEDPLWCSPSSAIQSQNQALESISDLPGTGTSIGNASNTPVNPQAAPTGGAKHLRIDDRTYFVVSATLEVLTLLQDYLRLVINLPLLTTDTMSRVIEFLKAFNSRTCQVVLGAGAMRSAGLKNITAKHLC
jgi:vacuolar protein sorting-associated protein 54